MEQQFYYQQNRHNNHLPQDASQQQQYYQLNGSVSQTHQSLPSNQLTNESYFANQSIGGSVPQQQHYGQQMASAIRPPPLKSSIPFNASYPQMSATLPSQPPQQQSFQSQPTQQQLRPLSSQQPVSQQMNIHSVPQQQQQQQYGQQMASATRAPPQKNWTQFNSMPNTQPIHSQPFYNGMSYSPSVGSQNVDQITNKMSAMSVTQNWNQMWSQESVNLMTEKDIRTKAIMSENEKSVNSQNESQTNCKKDIMRCTLSKVPDSASLLQKSRLPFGILIHPFKDDEVRNQLIINIIDN